MEHHKRPNHAGAFHVRTKVSKFRFLFCGVEARTSMCQLAHAQTWGREIFVAATVSRGIRLVRRGQGV
jgi:hypothetical protein